MWLVLYIAFGRGCNRHFVFGRILGLAAVGVLRFHKDARRQLRSIPDDAHLPPVSVLKPVHGLEAQLKENIESFFRQDYPDYEILFAADEAMMRRSQWFAKFAPAIHTSGPALW